MSTFISAALTADGHVYVLRDDAGTPWRCSVDPQDTDALDRAAPELSAAERAAILADWQGRPAPSSDESLI